MKKSIIALMGLFTLFACSDEVIQDVDKQSGNGIGIHNNENSTGNVVYTISGGYQSPYHIGNTERDTITYIFKNETDLRFDFYPVVRLCYYDGNSDTSHFGNNLVGPPINYINPPSPNSNEYITTVTPARIFMKENTTEMIKIAGPNILPTDPAGPKTPITNQFFDFSWVGATPQLVDFLSRYAKVVAVEGAFFDPNIGAYIGVSPSAAVRFPFMSKSPNLSLDFSQFSVTYPSGSPAVRFYGNSSLEIPMSPMSGESMFAFYDEAFPPFVYKGKLYKLRLYTTSTEVIFSLTY